MSDGGEFAGSAASTDAETAVTTERYRALADTVDEGLYQLDADGRIVDVNDALLDVLGADRTELLGERVAALFAEPSSGSSSGEQARQHAERVEETVAELRETDEDVADLEVPLRTADGEIAFRELRVRTVEYDGEFCGSVGVLRDDPGDGRGVVESEQRFEALVDGVEEYAIFMLDPNGRVVTWNSGAERIKGYEEEEIVGAHFSTFYTEADREAGVPAANLDAAMAEGSTEDEGWRVRADGSRFWANVTITAIRGDDGTLRGFAKVTRDMTDRRERERELERERAQTAKLLQTAPVSITVSDADGDTVLANQRAQEFLGLSETELLENLDDADHWTLYDASGERISPDELPFRRVLDEEAPVFDEEIGLDRPDGERKWFRVNAAPVFDSEGELERVISAAEDITDIKRRESEIRRRKDELETELGEVFGRVSDAFFAVDEEFRFTHVNERARELLTSDGRELVGQSLWEEFPEASNREFKSHYERALERQETVSFEAYHPDPVDTWFEVRVYPSESGLSVYFRDVTERKERERELEWFERVVENLPVGVYRNTPGPDGEFVEGNSTLASIFDADSFEELREYNVSDLYPDPERRAEFSRTLQREGMVEDFELEQETIEGETIWISVTAIKTEEDGEVYFDGIVQDVTERKERERELQRQKRRFEAVFEDPNILVGLLEPDGTVLDINRTAMEYVDADLADVTGESLWETPWLGVGDDVRTDVREWTQRAAAGEYVDFEVDLTRPDGRRYTINGVFRPVTNDDGDVVSIIVSSRDVTERKERERELEESEWRYRTLVEHFPNGAVALVDEELRYKTVGGDPMDVADATAEEIEGRPVEEALPPRLADRLVPCYEAALEGESGAFEIAVDGRIYQFQVVPVRDDDGDIFAALGMSQDVTEREEAQRKLAESERRYRTLAEYFPNGIVTLFDHNLRYTLAAGQGFDSIPLDPDDLEGRTFRDAWDDETARALEPAFLAALDGEERSVELEYAGREWIFRAVPITDQRGEVLAGMTMALDITERKRRERTLAKYETIVETINDGIYVKDEDGRFTMVNEAYAEMTGYDREELVGEHASLVVDEDTIEQSKGKIEEMRSGDDGVNPTMEAELLTADGDTVPTEGTFATLETDEGRREEVGVVRDITDRKERRRRLEKSEQRYRTLAEHFPNGAVGVYDRDLRFTLAEGQMLGEALPPADHLEGALLPEILPPDAVDDLEPLFRSAVEDGETDSTTTELGGRTWRVWATPLRDGGGDVFAGLSFCQDITEQVERQRKLEESRQRYRTLVENFPNGAVALFDEDLKYTVVGGALFEDLEMDEEEPLDKSIRDRFSDEELATLEPRFEGALEGEASEFEFQVHGRDLLVHTLPVEDADGEVFAGMLMVQDITRQKERERYFRDAKAQLEAATEAGAVGTWEWHIPEDRFVAGASLARTFGVDPEEAREGVSIDRMIRAIHEDDRERVESKIDRAVATCGEFEAEYRVRNNDGELRWVVARGHVETDEDGEPVTFPGAITDITKRKRAEQRLREQRKQLETLFEVLPVGAVVADEDGRFVEANEKAREIWGGDVFEASSIADFEQYAVRWADTGEPVDPEEYTMTKVLDGQEVTDDDIFEIRAEDGRERVIAANGMPVRDDDGEVSRGVVTLADITERREYRRRLEKSNERLEQFAYAASHDLQEPLRMVSSYLSLIERRYADAFDEDGEEFLEFAVDGADRMRDMIDALLEYSRVETRGDPLETVDLETVYEDALQDLEIKIAESGAEITADALPRVRGDGGQLRQVLQNLLSNAIEYSGDGPPRIHVDAERDGSMWVVSVSDDGIGIDPDHADEVFEVFNRLHTQDEHAGTGIGLALCRRIVERHGGRIWVDSEPGEGSTFYFTVPAEGEDNDRT